MKDSETVDWIDFDCENDKRHSLQAVDLLQRSQTAVQIVSTPHAPSTGGSFNHFLASRPCGPAGWLALLLRKAGDVETNPGPTTSSKPVWICDICYKQIHVRKQISIMCNRIEHGCTSDAQVSAKHKTQIPGPAIYTENPDLQLTQT